MRRTPLHPQWLLQDRSLLSSELKNLSADSVLDVGSADRWTEKMMTARCHYVALDLPSATEIGYESRPSVYGDAGCLPFIGNSFDAVLIFEVLEHLPKPARAVGEVARVLKPGGIMMGSMPFLYPIHDAPFDYQRFTRFGIQRELAAVNMELEYVRPSLGSHETLGLLACIGLAGACVTAFEQRSIFAMLVAPLLLFLIPIINLFYWAVGKCMPSWPALGAGYIWRARKLECK